MTYGHLSGSTRLAPVYKSRYVEYLMDYFHYPRCIYIPPLPTLPSFFRTPQDSVSSIHPLTSGLFEQEDIQRFIKEVLQSVSDIVYNEMYPYVWFICFYHVFLIFIIMANLVILLRKK